MDSLELKLGKYQHYKGKFYEVLFVARDSETKEEIVVYRALYDDPKYGKNALWTRPKEMFFENVIFDGKQVPRFKYIGDV
jgi:hypothetical protein